MCINMNAKRLACGPAELPPAARLQGQAGAEDQPAGIEEPLLEGELESERIAEQQAATDHLQPAQQPPAGGDDLALDGEMALDDEAAGGGEDAAADAGADADQGADAADADAQGGAKDLSAGAEEEETGAAGAKAQRAAEQGQGDADAATGGDAAMADADEAGARAASRKAIVHWVWSSESCFASLHELESGVCQSTCDAGEAWNRNPYCLFQMPCSLYLTPVLRGAHNTLQLCARSMLQHVAGVLNTCPVLLCRTGRCCCMQVTTAEAGRTRTSPRAPRPLLAPTMPLLMSATL